ncbi:MAG: SRPBCC family protein [Burkholderiales bacterium]
MLKTILIIVIVVIAGLLGYAATRPDSFRVERSASIKAPPEKIFVHINDFKAWNAWSPWAKKDPAMKATYGAVTQGNGATYQWNGNNEVGTGRMEIIDATPPSRVAIKLDFLKPFEAHNTVEFTVQAQGDGANVTWAMFGPQPFVAKIMGVFVSMDSMVGKDFEAGLANLKAVAEK